MHDPFLAQCIIVFWQLVIVSKIMGGLMILIWREIRIYDRIVMKLS